MKERPIIMTAESVCGILEGRKTHTRRVLKYEWFHGCLTGDCPHDSQKQCDASLAEYARTECPHGIPGDHLWVKEVWGVADSGGRLVDPCLNYQADGGQLPLIGHADPETWSIAKSKHEVNDADLLKVKDGWRNPRFMPRWASRLLLGIEDVRIERLQDISYEDCVAEGCSTSGFLPKNCPEPLCSLHHAEKAEYQKRWDSLNAKRDGGEYAWVWVLIFKRIENV